jgi:hypothetical protein
VLRPARLRALLDRHGGFTLEPRSGARVRHGVSVCTEPELSLRLRQWDTALVQGWLAERADAYGRPGRYVGGWVDRLHGELWLDVVTLVPAPSLAAALRAAGRHGQRAVFDLDRRRLVRVSVAS